MGVKSGPGGSPPLWVTLFHHPSSPYEPSPTLCPSSQRPGQFRFYRSQLGQVLGPALASTAAQLQVTSRVPSLCLLVEVGSAGQAPSPEQPGHIRKEPWAASCLGLVRKPRQPLFLFSFPAAPSPTLPQSLLTQVPPTQQHFPETSRKGGEDNSVFSWEQTPRFPTASTESHQVKLTPPGCVTSLNRGERAPQRGEEPGVKSLANWRQNQDSHTAPLISPGIQCEGPFMG